ncbi:hypothetical protein Cantr_10013 [Candida viswanathii]|uniref:Major facilitator superfamily (MFS) profile domain-containing protein n=1 Tax=Candida viswanathii TaxID=5486 RepID=A0A367YCJ7_9ASCO|nr:hypothetical protein Cantr_10013 [Candida viswanathii]
MSESLNSKTVTAYEADLELPNLEKKDTTTSRVTISQLPEPNHENISLPREVLFMAFMCLSQLLTQAGVAQTINIQFNIADTFGVEDNPGEMSWFAASYSMTVGTFILVSGRLGDMYGYKLLYVIGYVWFGIFSLMCGFAGLTRSTIFFTTMRGLQGMGPAIMMPNTQALISSYYPKSLKKDICLALFGAIAPTGFIVGSLFSGLFAVVDTWQWTFWTCGIISIFFGVCAILVIPKKIGLKSGGKFDYWGSFFGVSGLVLINFAVNQGPNVGWKVPYVYVLLIVGVLSMVVFFFVEKKVDDPLVPSEVLKGDTGFILGCIGAGWSCFGVWLYYTFRWSLIIDRDNPVMSGVKNIPCGPMGVIAAITSAILLTKIPSGIVMWLANLSFLVGIILMALRPVGQIYWAQKFVSLIIQPIGMDMSFPAGCILLSSSLPRRQQGIAGSLVSTFVNYSIAVGLGLAATVEYYTSDADNQFESDVKGMRHAFYMGIGLAGLGLLISTRFAFKQLRFRKKAAQEVAELSDPSDPSEPSDMKDEVPEQYPGLKHNENHPEEPDAGKIPSHPQEPSETAHPEQPSEDVKPPTSNGK